MVKIDPSYKYFLSEQTWPYALPLVNTVDNTPCGTALYAYRCEYSTLADHKEHHYIYYVFENKWLRLEIANKS